MGYKTILVSVDAGKNAAKTLGVAMGIADRFDSHVIGLHVRPRFQAPAFADGTLGMDALYRAHEESVRAAEATAADAFEKAIGTMGRPAGGRTSDWRVIDGFVEDELSIAARYADLVVVGQTAPDALSAETPNDLPEHVALSTERPVLVVPHIGADKPPGKVVMLCWNASREAARAATAALPLLAKADKVVVLIVDPKSSDRGHGAEPGADVAEWLTRHGAKVTIQRDSAADSNIGGVILSRAADHDADLIVMGVYGHSRMREFVLGGVSRTLLASMTVPLLIAH